MATAVSPAIRKTEEARGTRWQAAWIPLSGDDRFDDMQACFARDIAEDIP